MLVGNELKPETETIAPTAARAATGNSRLSDTVSILGLLLFAYFVRKAGVTEIIAGIKRLGFGFLLILAISTIRQIARSLAWMRCFEAPYSLRFRDAFSARVMGDALGNIVPLASAAVSEPSKAAFVTHRVPLLASLSALALENIFYSLAVTVFIFAGTLTLVLTFPLKPALRYASFATLAVTVWCSVGYFVIRRQWKFLSGPMSLLQRMLNRNWVEKAIPRARALEDRIYGFYQRNSNRFLSIMALEICFPLAACWNLYDTLVHQRCGSTTLLTAFILESVNRVINIVFKFIPFRLGVDEAGTGMLAKALGFTQAIGAALAMCAKRATCFGRRSAWRSWCAAGSL